MLEKLDPALIDFCRKALQRSERFAGDFLKQYMLRDDHEAADRIAHDLNDPRKYLSHAAVIDADRALELGLNVCLLANDDPLWQAYWRLYVSMRLALGGENRRLFEGRKASLLV